MSLATRPLARLQRLPPLLVGIPQLRLRPKLLQKATDYVPINGAQTPSYSFILMFSIAHPTLDTAGNLMLNLCTASTEFEIISLPPIRDLDWRCGNKNHLTTQHRRRAALGQRFGTAALPGQGCARCERGRGAFESCVVMHPQGFGRALYTGACMNCAFAYQPTQCSFRAFNPPKWIIELTRANNRTVPQGSVAQVAGSIPVPAHPGIPSSTSTQSQQHGPTYSAKWYRTPLDDGSLASDTTGMIAVREDLREIRARVEYDIKKLSKFAGDDGSDEEALEDNEPNPFYNSASEHGDDDTGLE
ncbi:unnamed protein product [Penicillium nalgiovense]|uniref:Uncharacterized protein n=2 Tax=Penicillium nalgiovense TaxID=60175 RepID=A0A9W4N7U9_PENNA|nr:unnamed protein product [Penicillium nalgiovense]CAG7971874.1 unnamed protein product [Penicillium nalgiovense]CAG7974564.1 unnamed protein product [Penicillium nalgiovense]CAG8078323.1 unnamed protein product [Penicillium nalgiovense]CAG8116418.1 unnamed protein product [Penicillium nalgiovense]